MDTAPSHIYTLSLHDALPISGSKWQVAAPTSSRVADRSAHAVAYWVPHTPRHWNRALGTTVGDWRLHCVVARGTRHQSLARAGVAVFVTPTTVPTHCHVRRCTTHADTRCHIEVRRRKICCSGSDGLPRGIH